MVAHLLKIRTLPRAIFLRLHFFLLRTRALPVQPADNRLFAPMEKLPKGKMPPTTEPRQSATFRPLSRRPQVTNVSNQEPPFCAFSSREGSNCRSLRASERASPRVSTFTPSDNVTTGNLGDRFHNGTAEPRTTRGCRREQCHSSE